MPKQDSTLLLDVSKLDAGFGLAQILKSISMQIYKNEVVALIGPSGCGKSTFLRCLNRLHEETVGAWVRGSVQLEGNSILGRDIDPVKVRSSIGMVFQKPNPFPGMSIFENVCAGLSLRGVRKKSLLLEEAERALTSAALWSEVKDKLNSPGSSLSGGQQQRLCIARALAIHPPVLLMDEPTSALDPISIAKIEELMRSLKKEVTILIVTHNMQQAARISDKTGFFLNGELVEFNETKKIFATPQDSRTENYITGRFG